MTISEDTDIILETGRPTAPPDLRALFSSALRPMPAQQRIRLGFAYATESGLESFLISVAGIPQWKSSEKLWVLGLHHGITEPSAVEKISAMPNSVVRLFSGGKKLSQADLLSGYKFHGKVICVDGGPNTGINFLLVSSANLTGAALGNAVQNYEIFLALADKNPSKPWDVKFDAWWRAAWEKSFPVSDSLLKEYAKFRSSLIRRNPDLAAGFDPPTPQRVKEAANLWIEAGAMSGGSRNQVEFSRSLAEFFGPISKSSRKLRISANGKIWDDRPLSPKKTTFGVDIWRLSLPTEMQGGFLYPARCIRLHRRHDTEGKYFELSVSDTGSRQHQRWQTQSHLKGYAGLTSGKRAFGFF
jgi:hypothetical protein